MYTHLRGNAFSAGKRILIYVFSYYGSKSKLVHLYPPPVHSKIIEPFAGAARYSLKYWERDVILYDLYEVVVRVWKYLIQASEHDILSLPDFRKGDRIDSHTQLIDEERYYVIRAFDKVGNSRQIKYGKAFSWDDIDSIRRAHKVLPQFTLVDAGFEQGEVAAECVRRGEWVEFEHGGKKYKQFCHWLALKGDQKVQWTHADGMVRYYDEGQLVYNSNETTGSFGKKGYVAIDTSYVYIHNGTEWTRWPVALWGA